MKKKPQLVFLAYLNVGEYVGIYRRKTNGPWRFKCVVRNWNKSPWLYRNRASSYGSLDNREGWHKRIEVALNKLPSDTWYDLNYMEINSMYYNQVRKKVAVELESVERYLSYSVARAVACTVDVALCDNLLSKEDDGQE